MSIEIAADLIHAVTLDTQYPFVLEEKDKIIGEITDDKVMKRLQFIGIYAKKKDLIELGEEEMANDIIVKGRRILLK